MIHKPGQNWLLLRGLSRETGHWGDFVPQMQATFPAANIHTLDLPGTGKYYLDRSPNNIADIVDFLRAQALEKGLLAKPLTILALSLGGMIAWEWLLKYPDDLNGAVLINTSFANLNPFYQRLHWRSYGKFAGILLQDNIYQRELAIIKLVSNRRDKDAKLAAEWAKIQTERPVSLVNNLRQIRAAARYRAKDIKPKQPVLLLNSIGDRLVDPACSFAIHDKWQIDIQTHPWAGHDLSLDDAAWVTQRLNFWIKKLLEKPMLE